MLANFTQIVGITVSTLIVLLENETWKEYIYHVIGDYVLGLICVSQ